MASVYILESVLAKRYYIGSCKDLRCRLAQHKSGEFGLSYTSNHKDWVLYYSKEGLEYAQSRKIESHIKNMKSRTYIQNLKKYPGMMDKLLDRYKS